MKFLAMKPMSLCLVFILLVMSMFLIDKLTAQAFGKRSPFKTVGKLHYPRSDHHAILLDDGRVLVLGGIGRRRGARGNDDILSETEVYIPSKQKFQRIAKMNYHRSRFTATKLQDGRVLIIGGSGRSSDIPYGHRSDLNTAEIFDPVTNQFQQIADYPYPITRHQAFLLKDGRVMIIGHPPDNWRRDQGLEEFSRQDKQYIVMFDPKTQTFKPWEKHPTLPSVKIFALARLQNGNILLSQNWVPQKLIGYTEAGEPIDSKDRLSNYQILNIQDGSIETYEDTSALRIKYGGLMLKDGRVLIYTGNIFMFVSPDGKSHHVSKATGRARNHKNPYLMALLPSGKILLAGGNTDSRNNQTVKIAEIYDPDSEEFEDVGSLRYLRYDHTLTTLRDGSVLVVGGGGWPKIEPAELYTGSSCKKEN